MIKPNTIRSKVEIPVGSLLLEGDLVVPSKAGGIVVFASGIGSNRLGARNRFAASVISNAGLGTLLFDLLTPEEEAAAEAGGGNLSPGILAERLVAATGWIFAQDITKNRRVGLLGAATGCAGALTAAAKLGDKISAVVSCSGQPGLAGENLQQVCASVLLIVGEADDAVKKLNEEAFVQMQCDRELKIIPRAANLFEEPGALETVAELSVEWFKRHLQPPDSSKFGDYMLSTQLF